MTGGGGSGGGELVFWFFFRFVPGGAETADEQAEEILSGITYYLSFPEEVYAAPQREAELVAAVTDSSGLTVTARRNLYRVG